MADLKEIVGAAAGFVTFCQMFSGVFLCRDIYKRGSTNNTPVMPFLGGFVISILFYQHAILLNDTAMWRVNVGGIFLNTGYLLFYYLWTHKNKKTEFYKHLSVGLGLLFLLLGYAQIENPEKVEFRFGMIVTIFLFGLIASPLLSLGEVIRTKSTKTLPFPMIISGLIVSGHWLLYGIIIKNGFVIFQNVVGFSLSLIQLSFFFIYPRDEKKVKKVK